VRVATCAGRVGRDLRCAPAGPAVESTVDRPTSMTKLGKTRSVAVKPF